MTKFLKVYDADAKQLAAIPGARVVASYPAFVVVEAGDAAGDTLSGGHLTEDITSQYQLEQGGLPVDTALARIDAKGKTLPHPAYGGAKSLPPGPHHYIVQFVGPIKKEWLAQLKKAGADVVAPYEGFAVIARMAPAAVAAVAKLPVVRWFGHLPYAARLSRHARTYDGKPGTTTPRTRYLDGTFTVEFFSESQAGPARKQIKALGFEIVEEVPKSRMLVVHSASKSVKAQQARLDKLSQVHGVSRISVRAVRRTSNDQAAVLMGTAASLGKPQGLGLSGAGETIGICDTGLDNGVPKTIHPDFTGRIAAIKSYPISPTYKKYVSNPGHDDGPADLDSGHGTHTSGSIVGSGSASANLPGLAGKVRGLSYGAKLVFQAVEQEMKWIDPANAAKYGRFLLSGLPADLKTLFSYAYGKGVRIHSNSWGGGDAGAYDDQCQQVDEFVWKNPDFCILFAAGNDGTDHDGDGKIDPGSVTPPGTAKNCITVGASENNRPAQTLTYGDGWPQDYPGAAFKTDRLADDPNEVAAFSSRGPTADNRIKPDIVSPGTYVLSTRSRNIAPNNYGYGRFANSTLYMFDSGTSMATPLTAGAVGVLREYLRTKANLAKPSAALLKAALVAGAVPTGHAAATPDNNEGFGRVNLDRVLAPAAPLKAAFVDGPGLATGALNERVVTVRQAGSALKIVLAYSDYPGPRLVNNLNLVVRDPGGTAHVGNSSGAAGFDSANNVEMVVIPQAPVGQYRVQVVGSNVPNGPQPFGLVVVGAT